MSGLYLHIPFCRTRCIYCDFHSGTNQELQERYVEALCREAEMRIGELQGRHIDTLYLGGGTPSQLPISLLQRLFDGLSSVMNPSLCSEVTIECNPDDLTPAYVDGLTSLPINRISMGVQSFDDDDLRFLRRRHSAQAAIDAVKRCQAAGYDNISIDLIYGLPAQNLSAWKKNVEAAIATGVQHISAYSLIFEEGTALYNLLQKGAVQECDDDLSLAMYDHLITRLHEAGYEQYEISNFAQPRRASRHNSSYWNDTPYLGLGAAAHSYDGACRRYNPCDTQAYIAAIEAGRCCYEVEHLTTNEHYNDMLLTRLRTREGIDTEAVKEKFGKTLYNYLREQATPYLRDGKMEYHSGLLRITREAIFISDSIISDLFYL